MPVVAFTAGSFGDILATAGIVIQITQTLLQSSASCKQYREIIDELKTLHRVLLLAQDATSHHDSHFTLSQSVVDSLKTEVCDCHLMMRSFLDNIRQYRRPLSKTGIQGLWDQIWWAIWEQDELEGLRKSIATRVQRIHLLLSSFNALTITDVSREIRDGNLAVNKLAARFYTSNPLFRELDDMTWVMDVDILVERIEMDPDNADGWHRLGRTYLVGNKYNKAHAAFQEAVNLANNNPIIWNDIAQLHSKMSWWSEALRAYEINLSANPHISETWVGMGDAYCNAAAPGSYQHYENLQYALSAYREALELDPANQLTRARIEKLRIQVQVHYVPSEHLAATSEASLGQGGTIDDEHLDDSASPSGREELDDDDNDETDDDYDGTDDDDHDETDDDCSFASRREEETTETSNKIPQEEEGQPEIAVQAE